MIKLSTINQIVEAIIAEGEAEWEIDVKPTVSPELYTKDEHMADWHRIANEAVIYLKMAMICEDKGIDKAMEYYLGTHHEDEYREYLTRVVKENKNERKQMMKNNYYISADGKIRKSFEIDNERVEIGNCFDTLQEAEKAVEKLKAWKRLKDAGFKFTDWYRDICEVSIQAEIHDEGTMGMINDLDLLFGDEK